MVSPSLRELLLYHHQGKNLFRETTYTILEGCIRSRDIVSCRNLHCILLFHDLDYIGSLLDHLIRLFGSYGHSLEASLLFYKAVQKSSYTWEALISTYVNLGENRAAFALYDDMPISPSKWVYLAVLRACATKDDADRGRLIYTEVVSTALDSDLVVESSLVNMYARCGELEDALKVFEKWADHDIVMWNTMITAYIAHGHDLNALKTFEKMQQSCVEPNDVTCVSLLKACANAGFWMEGWLIHDQVVRRGFESSAIVGNILIDFYAKCKMIEDSNRMFSISCQNLVSWNTKISEYVQHGCYVSALDLFRKMPEQGLKPDKSTFLSVIKACTNLNFLEEGQLVHEEAKRQGLGENLAVNNALIHMYSKGGNLETAHKIFGSLSCCDVVSWGAMISGYVQHGCHEPAFKLVTTMLCKGIWPEKVVFLCLMKSCGNTECLDDGRLVHHQMIERELEIDSSVASTMIDMYAKCKSLDEARNLFDLLPSRDVVSWSVMIRGYVWQENESLALDLFVRMLQENIEPDKVTYICLFKAVGNLKALGHGKQLHQAMIERKIEPDVVVGSTLVDMYVKCNDLGEARLVFDKLPTRNQVSWNVMIAGYLQHNQSLAVLDLFQKMMKEDLMVDKVTILGILKASGSVGAVRPGMVVHDFVVKNMMDSDVTVCNAVIDMYGKCGRLIDAHKVFNVSPNRDGISWNTLIAADARNESHNGVIQAFHGMRIAGFRPVQSTFTSVLGSCRQGGMLLDVQQHFQLMMNEYAMTPTVEHLNCIVDIFGRAGCFYEATHFIERLSLLPDVTTWLSLLAACRLHRNVQFGRICFNEAIHLDPNAATAYVLMSDIYSETNMWEDSHRLQHLLPRMHV